MCSLIRLRLRTGGYGFMTLSTLGRLAARIGPKSQYLWVKDDAGTRCLLMPRTGYQEALFSHETIAKRSLYRRIHRSFQNAASVQLSNGALNDSELPSAPVFDAFPVAEKPSIMCVSPKEAEHLETTATIFRGSNIQDRLTGLCEGALTNQPSFEPNETLLEIFPDYTPDDGPSGDLNNS
jgi:hypothetical protein